ncbi:hypothetical protein [Caulobacter segnis]
MAHNRFESPDRGPFGRLQDRLANSRGLARLRRAVFSRLPFPVLASDVRDVVYASWIVPLDRIAGEIPPGVAVLERDGRTIVTALTYRHGGFGPALAGPLRRLFPSPRQSNWRLYLARPGIVLFVKNVFDSALYALGTRLFSDALPSHHAARFDHVSDDAGCRVEIGGPGSAPGLTLEAVPADARTLPTDFAPFFATWDDAVRFLCLQDAAVARIEGEDGLAYARIDLPIDVATVQPLTATACTPGAWLAARGVAGQPFFFRVPAVPFRVLSETVKPSL